MVPGGWPDPRQLQSPWWQLEPQAQPKTPGNPKFMDPDMVLGSGPCPDVSMAPSGSTSHPDQLDPKHGMVLGH